MKPLPTTTTNLQARSPTTTTYTDRQFFPNTKNGGRAVYPTEHFQPQPSPPTHIIWAITFAKNKQLCGTKALPTLDAHGGGIIIIIIHGLRKGPPTKKQVPCVFERARELHDGVPTQKRSTVRGGGGSTGRIPKTSGPDESHQKGSRLRCLRWHSPSRVHIANDWVALNDLLL